MFSQAPGLPEGSTGLLGRGVPEDRGFPFLGRGGPGPFPRQGDAEIIEIMLDPYVG